MRLHDYTRRICVLEPKQIATQSGCVVDHCSWLTSAPALYAKIGSRLVSMGWLMDDKSQINACESSPAVQMWQELCGAQANALTEA